MFVLLRLRRYTYGSTARSLSLVTSKLLSLADHAHCSRMAPWRRMMTAELPSVEYSVTRHRSSEISNDRTTATRRLVVGISPGQNASEPVQCDHCYRLAHGPMVRMLSAQEGSFFRRTRPVPRSHQVAALPQHTGPDEPPRSPPHRKCRVPHRCPRSACRQCRSRRSCWCQ